MEEKQDGFSIGYVLVGLLLISVVVISSGYVFRSNDKQPPQTVKDISSKIQEANSGVKQNATTVTIPEWKITLKPSTPQTFQYKVDGDQLYFTTDGLASADSNCKLENKPIWIQRLDKPEYKDAGTNQTYTFEEIARPKKQVSNGKYYFLAAVGAPCTTQQVEDDIDAGALIESIEPIL